MSFNKEKFATLLEQAKGNRSINSFAEAAGVSNAHISKLLRSMVETSPEPKTIRKIADVAHNEVTYEDLLEAAGHIDDITGYVDKLAELRKLQQQLKEAEAATNVAAVEEKTAAQELADAQAEYEALVRLREAGAEYLTLFGRVPHISHIEDGKPIKDEAHIVGWDYVNLKNLDCTEDELYSSTVTRDSMNGARIYVGDKVLIKMQPDVADGEIAAVNIKGEIATLKRVTHLPGGKLLLIAENPNYQPIIANKKDVRIVGKVLRVIFDPHKTL